MTTATLDARHPANCAAIASALGALSEAVQEGLAKHWTRPPAAPRRHVATRTDGPRCSVLGCRNMAHSRTLCKAHYWRLKKYGDALLCSQRGPDNRWRLCRETAEGYVPVGEGEL